jgi:hypothetical protein
MPLIIMGHFLLFIMQYLCTEQVEVSQVTNLRRGRSHFLKACRELKVHWPIKELGDFKS